MNNEKLTIWNDQYATNPREEFDNTFTFLFSHGRYPNLGDTPFQHAGESGSLLGDLALHLKDNFLSIDDVIYFPVHMYEHSSISLYSGKRRTCDFDTGHLGFAYVSKAVIRSTYNVSRISSKLVSSLESTLSGELEIYTNYLNGDVFGFSFNNDSVGGFYGSDFETNGMLDYLDDSGKKLLLSNEFALNF